MLNLISSSLVSALLSATLVISSAHAAQTDAPAPPKPTGARAELVASGLEHPWGLAFLPSGDLLVTERPGSVRYITKSGTVSPPLEGAPSALAVGQGGMLDIALAPDFAQSRHVFIAFTESRYPFHNGTSVARLTLVGPDAPDDANGTKPARFTEQKIIFRMQPAYSGGLHFGARLIFSRDGKLFITLGERNAQAPAQDLNEHLGKVVRINPDGTVPQDNPFIGRAGAKPEIWSYGHRNPQAAALNPSTGILWVVEHGARGGDELNIIAPGKNYGWPVISYGTHYSGQKIGEGRAKPDMEQPSYYWDPSIAPSGMAFYTAGKHPAWRDNLFVGALKFRQIRRLILNGDEVVAEETLLKGLGKRIRAIRQSPDGDLYFLTDSPNGELMRLVPAQ